MGIDKKIFYSRKSTQTKDIVFKVRKSTLNGHYYITAKDGNGDPRKQRQFASKIKLSGHKTIPRGLYPSGAGFTFAGHKLLKALHEKFGTRFTLELSTHKKTEIKKKDEQHQVVLNQADFNEVLDNFELINAKADRERETAFSGFIAKHFPSHFKNAAGADVIKAGDVSKILKAVPDVSSLNAKDKEQISEIYSELVEKKALPASMLKHERFSQVVGKTTKVFIENVVMEFERLLARKTQSESSWQKFLAKYILLMRSGYAERIEKTNINISVKIPDFLLVDSFGHVDILEIKRPDKPVLVLDKDHDNYYWSAEMSKAIAQAENYLFNIQENRLPINEHIEDTHGIKVNIVRPRAYIFCGTRKANKGKKKEAAFRVLNDSLSHIDVVYFDDLLNGLKVSLSRLEEQTDSKD